MRKALSAPKHILFLLAFVLALPGIGFAAPSKGAEKPKLVLMPLFTKGVDDSMKSSMESALINGLQEKYKVFAGERVAKKMREVFDKVDKETKAGHLCDDTMCMQDIAIAFQADLVAIASVVKRESGYFP